MATAKLDDKEKTHLPLTFWSQIIKTMDTKAEAISQVYGYGKIKMEFIVFNGHVKDVVFKDEVRIRPDWKSPELKKDLQKVK